jgi:hypothetical protein
MRLTDALAQIDDIRRHLSRTVVFRGARAGTCLATAVIAVMAAVVQQVFVPDPLRDLDHYLLIWGLAAAGGILLATVEIAFRSWRNDDGAQRRLTLEFVEQFAPCLVAGALLTWAIFYAPKFPVQLLPGLWMILFAMGVFSVRRVLPRQVTIVGMFYLLCGLAAVAGPESRDAALHPWAMGAAFGLGQSLLAGILYWTLERREKDGHADA